MVINAIMYSQSRRDFLISTNQKEERGADAPEQHSSVSEQIVLATVTAEVEIVVRMLELQHSLNTQTRHRLL